MSLKIPGIKVLTDNYSYMIGVTNNDIVMLVIRIVIPSKYDPNFKIVSFRHIELFKDERCGSNELLIEKFTEAMENSLNGGNTKITYQKERFYVFVEMTKNRKSIDQYNNQYTGRVY